tara:strand:- start:171 stop:509 length:339 start_codon:yes stop_codon:yes gene_type:complete
MKKIEAIIKPFKLADVKDALHEIGLSGMTIIDVKGFGRQRGQEGLEKNESYEDEFIAKVMIEIIVEDENSEKAVEAIKKSAFSGKIGDGKIFISNIDEVIRIRTGEKGKDAV